MYCSYCASYGHLTEQCYAKPLKKYREPCYVEQLVPPSELKEFGIKTLTPLPVKEEKEDSPRVLEIGDNLVSIIAFLQQHGIRVPKKSAAKKQLEEYAAQNKRRLVFLP